MVNRWITRLKIIAHIHTVSTDKIREFPDQSESGGGGLDRGDHI